MEFIKRETQQQKPLQQTEQKPQSLNLNENKFNSKIRNLI